MSAAAPRSLRIAVHVDGPTIRGSERQVLLLVGALLERGHAVVASCRAGGVVEEELRSLGVPTTGTRPRGDVDLVSALHFAAWLRGERPDVLLLTSWKRAFIAAWAGRLARTPRIVLRNGALQRLPTPRLHRWKYRKSLGDWIDGMIVNSEGLRDYVLGEMPWFPADQVHLVPNAVATSPADPAPLRQEIQAPEDAVVVMGVGGLEPRKGFDLLIDALARLSDAGVHLVIAGSGPSGEALAARAAALAISDRVHLLGQRRDVPALLAAADVFVLSSREDSAPNVTLEAMQAGAAVIAAEVPGTRDTIGALSGRPEAGWIVPVDDVGALVDTLRVVVAGVRSGDAEVESRRAEARARIRDRFSIAHTVTAAEAALRGDPPAYPVPARST